MLAADNRVGSANPPPGQMRRGIGNVLWGMSNSYEMYGRKNPLTLTAHPGRRVHKASYVVVSEPFSSLTSQQVDPDPFTGSKTPYVVPAKGWFRGGGGSGGSATCDTVAFEYAPHTLPGYSD